MNPAAAGLSLLGFSFVYGVLHALGPGHGKIVITTWLATHPAKLKSSIGLTLAASLLQGLGGHRAGGRECWRCCSCRRASCTSAVSGWRRELFAGGCVRAAAVLAGVKKAASAACAGQRLPLLPRIMFITNTCGCGHQHLRPRSSVAGRRRLAARAAIVLSMGVRPCSGRSWFCCSASVIGVFGWGMAAALAMAAGTSLTITALALLVHGFRQLAIRLSRHQAPALWKQVSWATLALAGGVSIAGGGRGDVAQRRPCRRWDPSVLDRRRAQIAKWAPALAAGEAML